MHLVQKAYGGLDQVRVLDVQHTSLPVVAKEYKTTETLNIGLLGTLTDLKGARLVRQMLTLAKNRKANIRFILCGSSADPIRSRYFKQTGAYHPAMLPSMILEYDIDLFFISSICPETFSYTTQEAMEMECQLPVCRWELRPNGCSVMERERSCRRQRLAKTWRS